MRKKADIGITGMIGKWAIFQGFKYSDNIGRCVLGATAGSALYWHEGVNGRRRSEFWDVCCLSPTTLEKPTHDIATYIYIYLQSESMYLR